MNMTSAADVNSHAVSPESIWAAKLGSDCFRNVNARCGTRDSATGVVSPHADTRCVRNRGRRHGGALAFYRLLGLDIPADADGEGHVEVLLGGGVRLMFDSVAVVESFSDWEPPSGGRRIGLPLRCDSPAEVDEFHGRAVAAEYGSRNEPFDAFWGQRYATVLDADGNPVDLYAPLP